MAKKMQQTRGVLSNPVYQNEIVKVNKNGVITIADQNRSNVKRTKKKT